MADLIPARPGPFDFGRPPAALTPGQQCRWCPHPLGFVLNHQAHAASGVLGCCHCDNAPGGTT